VPKEKDKPKIIERDWRKMGTSPPERPVIRGAPMCIKAA